MENKDNIIVICKSCTNKRRKEWQKANKDLKIEKGDYVKGAFEIGKIAEHMWIEVQKIEKGVIYGKLSNQPIDKIIAKHYKIGQKVEMKISEIEDYASKEE